MADAESEVAALKKELQTVKQRAVGKIKTLTSQVDQLTKDLSAANNSLNSLQAPSPGKVSPPESSEEGSESSGASGFVKVKVSERELEERESALAAREENLAARERALAEATEAFAASAAQKQQKQNENQPPPAWHGVLQERLREVNANLEQISIAAEAVIT